MAASSAVSPGVQSPVGAKAPAEKAPAEAGMAIAGKRKEIVPFSTIAEGGRADEFVLRGGHLDKTVVLDKLTV